MSFWARIVTVLVISLAFGTSATAGFVDFESFSDGDLPTTEIPGLTFDGATVLTAGLSLNDLDFPPHSGSKVVAALDGWLTVKFDMPTNLVGGYISYADAAGVNLSLYDINNLLLADAFFAAPVAGPSNIVSNQFVLLGATNISRMVVSLNSPIPDNPFTLDDFTHTYISEPATVMLIALGLFAVHYSNKKSRETLRI